MNVPTSHIALPKNFEKPSKAMIDTAVDGLNDGEDPAVVGVVLLAKPRGDAIYELRDCASTFLACKGLGKLVPIRIIEEAVAPGKQIVKAGNADAIAKIVRRAKKRGIIISEGVPSIEENVVLSKPNEQTDESSHEQTETQSSHEQTDQSSHDKTDGPVEVPAPETGESQDVPETGESHDDSDHKTEIADRKFLDDVVDSAEDEVDAREVRRLMGLSEDAKYNIEMGRILAGVKARKSKNGSKKSTWRDTFRDRNNAFGISYKTADRLVEAFVKFNAPEFDNGFQNFPSTPAALAYYAKHYDELVDCDVTSRTSEAELRELVNPRVPKAPDVAKQREAAFTRAVSLYRNTDPATKAAFIKKLCETLGVPS